MLSFIKESPEGVSPLCTGVPPGSISKWQGGFGRSMHCAGTKWRLRQNGVTSEITKSGTDEQERDRRHCYLGK